MTSKTNDLSTLNEHDKLGEMFLAIYFNDFERVIEFKNHYPEIYAQKDCFKIEGNTTIDLRNLTYFNQIIWNDVDWSKDIMPLVEKHKICLLYTSPSPRD